MGEPIVGSITALQALTDVDTYINNHTIELVNKGWLESLRIARDALANSVKYQWHDLRKEPNNKPVAKLGVLFADESGHVYGGMYDVGSFWSRSCGSYDCISHVIAWKYVEPFHIGGGLND